MNSTLLTWIISALSVAGGAVFTYVVHYDVNVGTLIAQSIADILGSNGFTVSVVSPIGAPRIIAAPEIDAASGTSAIALLTGVLLLLAERSRPRYS